MIRPLRRDAQEEKTQELSLSFNPVVMLHHSLLSSEQNLRIPDHNWEPLRKSSLSVREPLGREESRIVFLVVDKVDEIVLKISRIASCAAASARQWKNLPFTAVAIPSRTKKSLASPNPTVIVLQKFKKYSHKDVTGNKI